MGLFGKPVSVSITEVEDPFPYADEVLKGTFEIEANKKDRIIKQYYVRFWIQYETEEDYEEWDLATEHSNHVDDDDFVLPYTLEKGQKKDVGFVLVLDESIKDVLQEKGIPFSDPHLKYFVQCDIATKGSLVDEKIKVPVNVVEGASAAA